MFLFESPKLDMRSGDVLINLCLLVTMKITIGMYEGILFGSLFFVLFTLPAIF